MKGRKGIRSFSASSSRSGLDGIGPELPTQLHAPRNLRLRQLRETAEGELDALGVLQTGMLPRHLLTVCQLVKHTLQSPLDAS